ncbi:hypothetical protein B5P43_32685 [Bacillus sp. SRB_336]|nr:hypothetical protein B5P43_32685 [Bacillus sp. SRB_336]
MANSSSGESMLHRVVRLLSVFDEGNMAKSVADIARRAGLPKTTAHRLIAEMVDERLLARTEEGEIQIGVRLWELANRASSMTALREAALPYMEDVLSVVQQHTTLGVLHADQMLYIERLGAHSSAVSIAKIAKRLPLYACSSGMVLLAYSPMNVQNEILGLPAKPFTRDTITNARELRCYLAEARRDGFAVMAGAIVPESTGVAVPVFGANNRIVAALNVIIPKGDVRPEAHVPVLKAAALAISRELGWRRASILPVPVPRGAHAAPTVTSAYRIGASERRRVSP